MTRLLLLEIRFSFVCRDRSTVLLVANIVVVFTIESLLVAPVLLLLPSPLMLPLLLLF